MIEYPILVGTSFIGKHEDPLRRPKHSGPGTARTVQDAPEIGSLCNGWGSGQRGHGSDQPHPAECPCLQDLVWEAGQGQPPDQNVRIDKDAELTPWPASQSLPLPLLWLLQILVDVLPYVLLRKPMRPGFLPDGKDELPQRPRRRLPRWPLLPDDQLFYQDALIREHKGHMVVRSDAQIVPDSPGQRVLPFDRKP